MKHQEYLRRNLLHATSIGLAANLRVIVERLEKMKKPPQWLLNLSRSTKAKADVVHPEMAKWRNAAPDAPHYMRGDR